MNVNPSQAFAAHDSVHDTGVGISMTRGTCMTTQHVHRLLTCVSQLSCSSNAPSAPQNIMYMTLCVSTVKMEPQDIHL